MNAKIAEVLAGLKAEPLDTYPLSELKHPEIVAQAVEALRRWAGIPIDPGGRAISQETIALLFGHGREGLLRLHAAYAEETARTEAESLASFDGIRRLARQACSMRLIPWNLDGPDVKPWTPGATGAPKLYVELQPHLDERLRATAAKRGESLREFVETSIADRLALIEKRPRPRGRKGISTKKSRSSPQPPTPEAATPVAIEAG